jgi:hypothetical protein
MPVRAVVRREIRNCARAVHGIVGYSKLLIEERKERVGQLAEIVLAASQVAKSINEQLG